MLLIAMVITATDLPTESKAGGPVDQPSAVASDTSAQVPIPTVEDMLHGNPQEFFANVEEELDRREQERPAPVQRVNQLVRKKLTEGMTLTPVDHTPVGLEWSLEERAKAEARHELNRKAAAAERGGQLFLMFCAVMLGGLIAATIAILLAKRRRS